MNTKELNLNKTRLSRVVSGYSKTPAADGRYYLKIRLKLEEIDLNFLRKIFDVESNDPDPCQQEMYYCYSINKDQAKQLQSYVIEGKIDVDNYDFVLEAYSLRNSQDTGIYRVVCGYSKIPDEHGEQLIKAKCILRPIDVNFLREVFAIDPKDPDPREQDVCYAYEINETQAKMLQPYIFDGQLDIKKYDLMLHAYALPERKPIDFKLRMEIF